MTASFFTSKKAAAIFKHAILDQYVDPFAMKTGKNSPGHRVVIIDGYAGEGRYDDGEQGSPALLLGKARKLAAHRQIECLFVEANKSRLAKLEELVATEGKGLVVETYRGDVQHHLDALLIRSSGLPLFIFFDPFGLMIPFEAIVKIFSRPGGIGAPATEAMINFSASGLRRIAGHLTSNTPSSATLARMDAVCGGTWWRDVWMANISDPEAAEEAVVKGYSSRLSKATHCGHWITDARNKAHHRAAYYLVFLTRHREGMLVFGESISLALTKWREAVDYMERKDSLFDDDELFKQSEEALAQEWVKELKSNLARLLQEKRAFVVADRYPEVYGTAIGKARVTHLRKAWKELHAENVTRTDSKGDLLKKRIEPA